MIDAIQLGLGIAGLFALPPYVLSLFQPNHRFALSYGHFWLVLGLLNVVYMVTAFIERDFTMYWWKGLFSAFAFFIWWRNGGDDDFKKWRRRLRKAGAKIAKPVLVKLRPIGVPT